MGASRSTWGIVRDLVARYANAAIRLASSLWWAALSLAAAGARLAPWLGRRLALSAAPLYPPLKWVGGAALFGLLLNLLADFIGQGFDLPVLDALARFMQVHRATVVGTAAAVVILSAVAWVGHRMRSTDRRLCAAFALCRDTEDLTLGDLGFRRAYPQEPEQGEERQDLRPFFGKYFPRILVAHTEADTAYADTACELAETDVERLIREGRSLLLRDLPYSGKTLTVWHILRRLTGYTVVKPDDSQRIPEEAVFSLLKNRKVVILLDNLSALADTNYNLGLFVERMTKATKHRVGVVGTCRTGGDYAKLGGVYGSHVACYCECLLNLRFLWMSVDERVDLAATAGVALDRASARHYPTPGSITMRSRVRAVAARFAALPETSKDVLRVLKFLDASEIAPTIARLQTTLSILFDRDLERNVVKEHLRDLWDQSFLLETPTMDRIRPHFGHLVYAVSYERGQEPGEDRRNGLAQAFEEAHDAEALLGLSRSLARTNDLVSGLLMLDRLVRIAPDDANAHFHRGYTLARLGRAAEALDENDRALALRPTFAEAYNNRSYILSRLGRLPDALQAVDHAIELRPDYDDAHTNRAVILARLGRFDDAQAEFAAALRFRPQSYYAYANLGVTLSRQGAFREALAANEKALRIRPRYPEAHWNRGITLARMGLYEEALKAQEQAIALRPEYAQAHMHRGQSLASLGRYLEAVAEHSRAIELQPGYALAYLNRARTYAHLGAAHLEAAFRDWQTAVDLGLAIPPTAVNIGDSLGCHGEFRKARAVFDSVILWNPDCAEAYASRGQAVARMGECEDALADFANAIRLRPDFAEAYRNRGVSLAQMNQFEAALADFTYAITLYPGSAEAYRNRGLTLARMREYGKAVEDFDRAIEICPTSTDAHVSRGITLSRSGQFEEALAAFKRAIELEPRNARAQFEKAKTLCLAARGGSQEELLRSEHLEEAVALLESSIALDHGLLDRVVRERGMFSALESDPGRGSRFCALAARRGLQAAQ